MTVQRTTDWLTEPGVQEALAAREHRAAFDPERFAAAVAGFAAAVEELNTSALGSDVLPWTDAVTLLAAIREARKIAQTVESNLEVRAAKAMQAAGEKQAELDGVGVVEWRRGSGSKSWASEQVAGDVLGAQLRRVGGELVDPFTVRDWLLEAAHVDYWRTTVLRDLDLDPDDYCERTPGRLTVQITHPG